MAIFYIISMMLLGLSFLAIKKSDEKQNILKWFILMDMCFIGLNTTLGMILGVLNIKMEIWLLSIIYLILAALMGCISFKKKEFQKYTVRKIDIFCVIVILIIFGVMFVKDLYIFHGDVTHFAIDSAIHYRAAKHYSENLKIFVNCEDKTFFNFNVMQTGAYINDGIFMNVIHSLTGMNYAYIYQIFETLMLYMTGLGLYAIVMEKIETKKGAIASLILFALYMYGYPYNTWLYGFSYLAVGNVMVVGLASVVPMLYSKDNLNKKFVLTMLVLLAIGLTFSYCLFIPFIFAAICIYCFIRDFSVEGKTYLKMFKKTTIIVTLLLLLVAIAGFLYLFLPTFYIEGQENLVDALKADGAIYSEKYKNFIMYIPFAILYVVELYKRIKNKEITYVDVFSVLTIGFLVIMYAGMLIGKVSPYYMLKIYFVVWPVIFINSIDVVNKYIDEKIFALDKIILIILFVLCLNRISAEAIFRTYLIILLAFYVVTPYLTKNVNFKKLSLKVTPLVYVVLWGGFVFVWVWLKAGMILPEDTKHALPNLVGIYYIENCEYRKLNDLTQNFNKNDIEITTYARENIDDMTAENVGIIQDGYYSRVWATAMLEIDGKMPYQYYIQDMTPYTIESLIKDKNKKYIVRVIPEYEDVKKASSKELKEFEEDGKIEVLFQNENGYVAKIIR